uniref:ABC transporter domain-containing protein n=1 Tax=Tetradesmus obliquus TaxID=3088 RepID=A0A383VRM2_TETOB|eukprot:jgi/Sobl393_1/14498/SZX68168.1
MFETAIVGLWVPVVVFAHVFSAFWFIKTFLVYDPRPLHLFRRRRSSGVSLPKARVSEAGGETDKTVDEVLDSSCNQKSALSNSLAKICEGSSQDGHSIKEASGAAVTKVEKVHLEWQQLCCTYNAAGGKIVVLDNIWGQATPGEMQALLGPSGAGKSTLMDILAQRKSTGNLSGFLLANGRPTTSSFIRKTAYVPQDDNFVATMTTSETMSFYADIILPKTWSKADRRARVVEVLAAMGLKPKQRTMVGGTLPGGLMLRGLSGGERKRLSIAAGILAAPSIVFLDEPTSGLDSFAALTVMGYLKRMARDNGHIVIASIHQPRSAIWSMFDKVTLLASGRLMFHGVCDDLVPWFGHLGYPYDASLHGVASDWALDLVAIGFHKPKRFYGHTITNMEQLTRASNEFVASYTAQSGILPFGGGNSSMIGSKSLGQKMQARMNKMVGVQPGASAAAGGMSQIARLSGSSDGDMYVESLAVTSAAGEGSFDAAEPVQVSTKKQGKWATGWWRHFISCYNRELLAITRNPADVAGRTMTFAWVAILMGLLYYGMSSDASSIRGRLNMVFNNLVFFCLMPYVSMSLYCADKKFYIADASAKLYRSHAYYPAKVVAITPFQIVSALVFCFTVYGMTGLRPGWEYILQNGTISTLLLLISVQVLHCCAIVAPNQDVAFMLSIVWTAIQLFFSNYFIMFSEVELYGITFLRWFSALCYAFEGIMVTEFGNMTYACDKGLDSASLTMLKTMLPGNRFLNMPVVQRGLESPGADCIADTNAVLHYYGFDRTFGKTFGILLGYLTVCHVLTYMAMIFVARKERR